MKYAMEFPNEILEMDFIGYKERDKFKTYLVKQVEERFKITGLNAYRVVMGHPFSTNNQSSIKFFVEEFYGKLIEVEETAASAG